MPTVPIPRKPHNCTSLSLRQDDPNAVYKLATSDSARALNTSELSKCAQRPATEVAEEMRRLILRLYGQFLSEDGSAVDYKGIGQSADYKVGEQAGEGGGGGGRQWDSRCHWHHRVGK